MLDRALYCYGSDLELSLFLKIIKRVSKMYYHNTVLGNLLYYTLIAWIIISYK